VSLPTKDTPDASLPPRDRRSLARLNEILELLLFAP
jgi:hypothetical protein